MSLKRTQTKVTRVQAVEACIERFAGKPYEPGKRDCAIMAAHLLHQFGIKVSVLKGATYKSEAGALRAMRRAGFNNILEAVDSLGLTRIAPARAMVGDLVGMPSACAFGCSLAVSIGNRRLLGIYGDVFQVVEPHQYQTAWRVS